MESDQYYNLIFEDNKLKIYLDSDSLYEQDIGNDLDVNNFINEQIKINRLDCLKDGAAGDGSALPNTNMLNDLNLFKYANAGPNYKKDLEIYEKEILENNKQFLSYDTWIGKTQNSNKIEGYKYVLWESGLGANLILKDIELNSTFGSYIDPLEKDGVSGDSYKKWPDKNFGVKIDQSAMNLFGFTDSSYLESINKNHNWDFDLQIGCGDCKDLKCSIDNVDDKIKYCVGNQIKKIKLSEGIDNDEKIKYIVIKEWGDKMQVLIYFIMYHVYQVYEKSNVIMVTTDVVVLTLCITLKIPCIYTGNSNNFPDEIAKYNLKTKSFGDSYVKNYRIVHYKPGDWREQIENEFNFEKSKMNNINNELIAKLEQLKTDNDFYIASQLYKFPKDKTKLFEIINNKITEINLKNSTLNSFSLDSIETDIHSNVQIDLEDYEMQEKIREQIQILKKVHLEKNLFRPNKKNGRFILYNSTFSIRLTTASISSVLQMGGTISYFEQKKCYESTLEYSSLFAHYFYREDDSTPQVNLLYILYEFIYNFVKQHYKYISLFNYSLYKKDSDELFDYILELYVRDSYIYNNNKLPNLYNKYYFDVYNLCFDAYLWKLLIDDQYMSADIMFKEQMNNILQWSKFKNLIYNDNNNKDIDSAAIDTYEILIMLNKYQYDDYSLIIKRIKNFLNQKSNKKKRDPVSSLPNLPPAKKKSPTISLISRSADLSNVTSPNSQPPSSDIDAVSIYDPNSPPATPGKAAGNTSPPTTSSKPLISEENSSQFSQFSEETLNTDTNFSQFSQFSDTIEPLSNTKPSSQRPLGLLDLENPSDDGYMSLGGNNRDKLYYNSRKLKSIKNNIKIKRSVKKSMKKSAQKGKSKKKSVKKSSQKRKTIKKSAQKRKSKKKSVKKSVRKSAHKRKSKKKSVKKSVRKSKYKRKSKKS